MKRFFVRILDYVRARKTLILYVTAATLLLAFLAGMIINEYSSHDENMEQAYDDNQLVVFDLTTGEEADIAYILHDKSKHPVKEKTPPAKTAATIAPAVPIKQADIMFIINNLGLNKTDSESALDLPPEFILSFSPYNDQALELSKSAHDKGHVTLADLPTQLIDGNETPGNLALTIENNDFKNGRNFDAVLSKIYQASGVLTPPNDIFSRSSNFTPILHEISRRKLFLVYGGEGDDIDTRAHDNDVELLKIDMILTDSEDLAKQLANVESMVVKSGLIVVMIKAPSSETVDVIGKWAASLKDKHIRLISSSK